MYHIHKNIKSDTSPLFGFSTFMHSIYTIWSEEPKSNTVDGFIWFSFSIIKSSNNLVFSVIIPGAIKLYINSNFFKFI